jgi:hypothetical protein
MLDWLKHRAVLIEAKDRISEMLELTLTRRAGPAGVRAGTGLGQPTAEPKGVRVIDLNRMPGQRSSYPRGYELQGPITPGRA